MFIILFKNFLCCIYSLSFENSRTHSSNMGRVKSVSASLTDRKVLCAIELWLTALECVRADAHAISCASDLAHNLTLHLANAFRGQHI